MLKFYKKPTATTAQENFRHSGRAGTAEFLDVTLDKEAIVA